MEKFSNLKEEILIRARNADACRGEYKRAYYSNNSEELLTVVKDNFNFCCNNRVIDASLIKEYEDLFNASKIYVNVNVTDGYLLASGNATVEASGNATVEASGNATVRAWDNATVRAWDNAYITSYTIIEAVLKDNAIYRVRQTNTIYYSSETIKFETWKNPQ